MKVVVDLQGGPLFQPRMIPYARDHENGVDLTQTYWRHIGIYAYRMNALADFCA